MHKFGLIGKIENELSLFEFGFSFSFKNKTEMFKKAIVGFSPNYISDRHCHTHRICVWNVWLFFSRRASQTVIVSGIIDYHHTNRPKIYEKKIWLTLHSACCVWSWLYTYIVKEVSSFTLVEQMRTEDNFGAHNSSYSVVNEPETTLLCMHYGLLRTVSVYTVSFLLLCILLSTNTGKIEGGVRIEIRWLWGIVAWQLCFLHIHNCFNLIVVCV